MVFDGDKKSEIDLKKKKSYFDWSVAIETDTETDV